MSYVIGGNPYGAARPTWWRVLRYPLNRKTHMTEFSLAVGIIILYIGLERRLSRLEQNIIGNIDHLKSRLDSR